MLDMLSSRCGLFGVLTDWDIIQAAAHGVTLGDRLDTFMSRQEPLPPLEEPSCSGRASSRAMPVVKGGCVLAWSAPTCGRNTLWRGCCSRKLIVRHYHDLSRITRLTPHRIGQ